MKTFSIKSSNIKRHWYYVDATNKILGRLASALSFHLRGKHKTEYTPHLDTGDYIIVINASKILVTGNKRINKIYYHHTGYVGGIKQSRFEEMISSHPERVIEIAVKGMLPKGALGRSMFKKLKVFSNENHEHIAQCPQLLNI
ncbi:50S ribosomal protein L13 [Buchnera aphidicola str. APS (Acyrthosiphon pisum)]|uniref:Large ribosomal subunit protein uL13 n=3 Tax=Buchnera aphidicola TaxID=9 RepID=RL13_BUCAI|nr:50S ribosomal protein L13 [Buchnera aphidicola]B8D7S6.1 RecName: Full=Large ribosomal subunit protein uL13; AltName: Full=50S ribosomal protein L13 [Buchnera aphidicola str. Tuc7 (Acyrthosiphon pisum)]B8D9H4.1 RecName: Full=Large ribosomal subunit protein uL13; AltName: Full=50S ribosomal protein L13 [Buchnera aphidicola str. 5A (Acyrthosiphon pisum)]P57471.1 RecName: Full=Large ribosomal subunit protein uL13; AltName: Full=50S ribosomal protein L13 [Buchnera aphidicola str. APS (Acyrthosipho